MAVLAASNAINFIKAAYAAMSAFPPLQTLAAADIASHMDFTIRAATACDIPSMHRVRGRVRENRLSDPQRISEASYLPYFRAGSIWVAETHTAILGFAALDKSTRNVWALFVDPDVEGVGIGRALHRQMLLWAREQGLARLTLSTGKGTRAADFYRKAGWTEVGMAPDGQELLEILLLS